jgi:hypothetical protein
MIAWQMVLALLTFLGAAATAVAGRMYARRAREAAEDANHDANCILQIRDEVIKVAPTQPIPGARFHQPIEDSVDPPVLGTRGQQHIAQQASHRDALLPPTGRHHLPPYKWPR